MKVRRLEQPLSYDGSQLRPHWILRTAGLVGDALVAFRGPCHITANEMADLEDLLAGSEIAGADMVHFVWETFDDGDLTRAVLRQRLLASLVGDTVRSLAPGAPLRREGDDLYVGEGKLSISVATRSLVSTLIHFGVNVTNEGTPVTTASLTDLEIDPGQLADRVLDVVHREEESLSMARCQVRPRAENEG